MDAEPLQHQVDADGARLAVFEWGRDRRGAGRSVLLAHATGFHARCWDPIVIRAKRPCEDRDWMDFSSSPTWPGLAGELRNGRETHLPEASHFLPLEDPDRAAAWIEEELGA